MVLERVCITSSKGIFCRQVFDRPINVGCFVTFRFCLSGTFNVCRIYVFFSIFQISHLSVGWQIPDTSDADIFTFYYHPPSELISKAFATLIKELEWDRFTIFYEDDGSKIILNTKNVSLFLLVKMILSY